MRSKLTGSLLGLVLAVTACEDRLVVPNLNQPDRTRALAAPVDVENLVLGTYRLIHNATTGAGLFGVTPGLYTMGMENYSGNANEGMGPRGGIPRATIDNSRGNQNASNHYSTFLSMQQQARAAALGLSVMNDPSFAFIPVDLPRRAADRMVAYMSLGIAQGLVALAYDSAAVVSPADPAGVIKPLVGYDSLIKVALAYLDSAIAIAAGSPTPAALNHITGNAAMTPARFAQIARGYKARLSAAVARTPTERAGRPWSQILADANAAITTDFAITMGTGFNWGPFQMNLYQSWHSMWAVMIGMADTSTNYRSWLATAPASRDRFFIFSPDQRFPQGATRAAQQASSGCGTGATCTTPAGSRIYFRNRPDGQDIAAGDLLAYTYYDFQRAQAFFSGATTWPVMTVTEMNLLKAEANIRLGNYAAAITEINKTRTFNGLTALPSGMTVVLAANGSSTGAAVPDENTASAGTCVPRIPTSTTATTCGNLWEAFKWEYRMEMAYIGWASWYFAGRGWGDLPNNTPLHYPVPFQELDARQKANYTYLSGAAHVAALSRYGF